MHIAAWVKVVTVTRAMTMMMTGGPTECAGFAHRILIIGNLNDRAVRLCVDRSV